MFRGIAIHALCGTFVAVLAGLVLCIPASRADETSKDDLIQQQQKQKEIQAETDRLVRRVTTMIRVLDYNRLDESAQKKMLEHVKGVLAGLSKEQMAQVIAGLEAAVKKTGPEQIKDIEEIQKQHEQIVAKLKSLLAEYDALKNLEQAAERLVKLSRDQTDLCLQTRQLVHEAENLPIRKKSNTSVLRADKLAGEQKFLLQDLSATMQQLGDLKERLLADQKGRADAVEALCKTEKLEAGLAEVPAFLRSTGLTSRRLAGWNQAAESEWKAAGDLLTMAFLLYGPREKLQTLRDARQRVDRLIEEEKDLREEVVNPPELRDEEKLKLERAQPNTKRPAIRGKQPEDEPEDPLLKRAQGLADRQGWAEYETQEVRFILKPHVELLANLLTGAEKAFRESSQKMRGSHDPKITKDEVTTPLDQGVTLLLVVRAELDRLIGQAEAARGDPLINLKDALAKVERIIAEQKDVRDKTDEAAQQKETAQLPAIAPKQTDLQKRTDALKQEIPGTNAEAKSALEKAAKEMESATQELQEKKGTDAVPKQDQALNSLQEAKKALADQIAQTEKRRDEITRLEDAQQKIGELIKQEGKVADKAHELGKQADKADPQKTQDLAKQQNDIKPQAKDLGKQLEQTAPEAAKHIDDSTKHMEAAKNNLDQKQLPPAAKDADNAKQKLMDAEKALAKALEDKKAQEAAEQAKAQPNNVDPEKAAQQIAKALEQAKEAEKNANQAAQQQNPHDKSQDPQAKPQDQKGKPDLAELQKQVGDKAGKLDLPEAKKAADAAAEAIEKGDLNKAIQQQQKALDNLNKAAQQEAQKGSGDQPKGSGDQPKGSGDQPKGSGDQPKGSGDQPKGSGDQPKGSGEQPKGSGDDPKGSGSAPAGDTPTPEQAKNPGELAQAQKALKDATEALQKSQQANEAAQAALAQAQAQAPQAVQPQLQQAGKQLGQAAQQLGKGQPAQAGQAQAHAAQNLQQALDTLNNAVASNKGQGSGEGSGQGSGEGSGEGSGQGSGQGSAQGSGKGSGQGSEKGSGQGSGQKPGKSQEKNDKKGSGNRIADGQANNGPSELKDTRGDAAFLNLPPRQRELIKQAMSEKLPPEYAALIQQYYLNIARGKAAPTEPKR